ncbi:beta-ketoacyl synthase chain length factor [Vibrio sp. WJH972]
MKIDIKICVSGNLDSFDSLSENISLCNSSPNVPKSILRRSSTLTKKVLSFSDFIVSSNTNFMVFATRHGELSRTYKLLHSIASGQELSPTQFAQSVHSTAPGLLTISNKKNIPFTTISAEQNTFVMALVEAITHLKINPTDEVCVIYADECVPDEIAPYISDDCELSLAIKLRVGNQYIVDVDTENTRVSSTECDNRANIFNMINRLSTSNEFQLTSTSLNLIWTRTDSDRKAS